MSAASRGRAVNISIGLHKVEPFVTSGVVEVFGESCEITDLQDSAEIETFIAADQFPDIKILIIPVQNLTVSADFWPNLKLLSDKVQTFHLILLKASDMILPESLPLA